MTLPFNFFVLAVLCISFVEVYCNEPCILYLSDIEKTPLFRPFVYNTDNELYPTQNDQIKILHGQDASLYCHDNLFKKYPDRHNLSVTCADDNLKVKHDGTMKKFKDLNCDLRVVEEVKNDVPGCVAPHRGINYQFFDSKQGSHIKLAEVCYDFEKDTPAFARVVLSKNIETDPKLKNKANLPSNTEVTHRIKILTAQRAAMRTLKFLLTDMPEESLVAVKLISKDLYSQQLLDVEKFPTNIVSLWDKVAHGNWQRLLNDIKSLAEGKKNNIEVVFGSHGTLSLPNAQGKNIKLHLGDEDKIPVPQYVWAVVSDEQMNQAVAVVVMNNPFISVEQISSERFCTGDCSQITWLRQLLKGKNNDRPVYGYTFCCSVEKFKIFPSTGPKSLLTN